MDSERSVSAMASKARRSGTVSSSSSDETDPSLSGSSHLDCLSSFNLLLTQLALVMTRTNFSNKVGSVG